MPRKLTDPVPRFWSRVEVGGSDDCWEWKGGIGSTGYGVVKVKTTGRWRTIAASRFALEIAEGLRDDMQALHHCDNPLCCNPAHLYWGTPQDNVNDMRSRNRARYVSKEDHGMAKLTQEEVLAIRASDEDAKVLSARYGVSVRHVRKIRQGVTW